jgi:hypothetical protein
VGNAQDPLRSIAAALAALLFLTYGYFFAAPSWNENSRFALTRSIVERGRLDIDPYQHETGDKAFARGHHFSDKAPGPRPGRARLRRLSPLPARHRRPPAVVDRRRRPRRSQRAHPGQRHFRRALYLCNLFTNALAGAALGGLFFLLLVRRFALAPRPRLAATLALAVGTLVLPYATMFYGHVLVAAFLFGPSPDRAAGGAGRLAGAGALCGLAVLTELTAAPAALLLLPATRPGSRAGGPFGWRPGALPPAAGPGRPTRPPPSAAPGARATPTSAAPSSPRGCRTA